MKNLIQPEIMRSPLLKLSGEKKLTNNEYKIHKELIKKEFIKKVINGEITTEQIKNVLNKKNKSEKN